MVLPRESCVLPVFVLEVVVFLKVLSRNVSTTSNVSAEETLVHRFLCFFIRPKKKKLTQGQQTKGHTQASTDR